MKKRLWFLIPVLAAAGTAALFWLGVFQLNHPSAEAFPVRGVDVSHYQGNIDWAKVKAAGIDFGKIAVEVTESAVCRNNEQVLSQLERFQELGFKVWMDDYGSGSASPVMLQRVHFDLLKI